MTLKCKRGGQIFLKDFVYSTVLWTYECIRETLTQWHSICLHDTCPSPRDEIKRYVGGVSQIVDINESLVK